MPRKTPRIRTLRRSSRASPLLPDAEPYAILLERQPLRGDVDAVERFDRGIDLHARGEAPGGPAENPRIERGVVQRPRAAQPDPLSLALDLDLEVRVERAALERDQERAPQCPGEATKVVELEPVGVNGHGSASVRTPGIVGRVAVQPERSGLREGRLEARATLLAVREHERIEVEPRGRRVPRPGEPRVDIGTLARLAREAQVAPSGLRVERERARRRGRLHGERGVEHSRRESLGSEQGERHVDGPGFELFEHELRPPLAARSLGRAQRDMAERLPGLGRARLDVQAGPRFVALLLENEIAAEELGLSGRPERE